MGSIGDTQACSGLWRFFGQDFPIAGGISGWNAAHQWKDAWQIDADNVTAIGEDVFGNQLILMRNDTIAKLWDHESGEICDLLLDISELLTVVLREGLRWIDHYHNSSLDAAISFGVPAPLESHLHWRTPLVLGGPPIANNIALVERSAHLRSHAALWSRIRDLPPGSTIIAHDK